MSRQALNNIVPFSEQMEACLAERNLAPQPCRWRAKGADIPAKLQRARKSLENVTSLTCGTGH